MAAQAGRQVPVAFEDVALCFSPEEWALLTDRQRELYQDVMQSNFEMVASLGSVPLQPELLCRMEQGEEPCVAGGAGQGDGAAQESATSGELSMSRPEPAVKEESDGDWSFPPLQSLCPSWCQVELTDIRSLSHGAPLEMGAPEGPELLICGECGRSFEDACVLADHQAIHEEQKGPFTCLSCGKLFRYRLSLLTHKKHQAKARLACAPCGLWFCLKGDLLRHRVSHTARGLHPCGACGLAFHRKSHLLAHEAVEHAGRVVLECPECGVAVGGEAELAQHRAAHREEERPFACAWCMETFSWKESLQLHQRLHAQEGGHICPDCGKSFSRRGNLLAHQRLHTGELPFSCSECERAFPTRVSLVAHSKMHRRARPFTCLQCGRCFRSQEKLLEHQSSHGGQQEQENGVQVKKEEVA